MGERPITFAGIDVGSNATKLSIWLIGPDGQTRELTQKRFPMRLEDAFRSEAAEIGAAKAARLIDMFREIAELTRQMKAEYVRAVATEAFRSARNGPAVAAEIEHKTGLRVETLTPQEEGRLVSDGVMLDFPGKERDFAIIDVGGGSAQVILPGARGPRTVSLPIGAVRLRTWFMPSDPIPPDEYEAMCGYVEDTVAEHVTSIDGRWSTSAIGVGGGARFLHAMCAVLKGSFQQDQPLRLDHLEHLTHVIWPLRADSLVRHYGIDLERAEIIIPGAVALLAIMKRLGVNMVKPSRRSVRDGLLVHFQRSRQ